MKRHKTLCELLPSNLVSYGSHADYERIRQKTITQITCDSRAVEAREQPIIFFAVAGQNFDGHSFINDVADKNAAVIVISERPGVGDNFTHVRVDDINKTMAVVAKNFYGRPDEGLNIVAITGTNGKTTTAHLCHAMLSKIGLTGVFGTLGYHLGKATRQLPNTTPAAIDLFHMLAEARNNGCRNLAMEVSSHALASKRIYGLHHEVAVFTNLSPEHLDFHKTLEEYFADKKKLFDGCSGHRPRCSIVNIDDGYGKTLFNVLKEFGAEVHSFGFSSDADFSICQIRRAGILGTHFAIKTKTCTYQISSPLFGDHNLLNITAGFASAMEIEKQPDAFISSIEHFCGVAGRLERIDLPNGARVFIDYAHTPHALEVVIKTLNAIKPGRLITVFGCGGDRDASKRAPMTSTVNKLSNFSIATSDNPRKEPQEKIFSDMSLGIVDSATIEFITDRQEAIYRAIALSRKDDIILIAGKGHETYQILGDASFHFDDKEVVMSYFEEN